MPWSLASDGFHDYTPTAAYLGTYTTKIYYVAEDGNNATAVVNDESHPFRTLTQTREFTLTSPGSATRGARYTSTSGAHYYVVDTISGGSSIVMIENDYSTAPTSGHELTRTSGSGDDKLFYSGTGTVRNGAVWQQNLDRGGNGHEAGIVSADWILVRRGDTFEHQNYESRILDGSNSPRGAHSTEPFLIGCYDPSITATDSAWGTAGGHSGQYCVVNPANSALARPIVTWNAFGKIYWFDAGPDTTGNLECNNIVIVGFEMPIGGASAFVYTNERVVAFFRVEDCYLHDGGGEATKGGMTLHRCIMSSLGQILEGGGPPVSIYDTDGYGTLFKINECVLDLCAAGGGLSHMIYGGGDANPTFGVDPGPTVMSGCTLSRTPQADLFFRSAGTTYNNTFMDCQGTTNTLHGTGIPGDRQVTISYNVNIHNGSAQAIGGNGANGVYTSNDMNQGTALIDHNIYSQEVSSDIYPSITTCNNSRWTISNNIFYKVSRNVGNSAVIAMYDGGTTLAGAVFCESTISNPGSGYTDKSINITGLSKTTGFIANADDMVVCTVTLASLTGWPWTTQAGATPLHTREGWVVLGGFNSPYNVLNGKICRVYLTDESARTVQLQGNFFTELNGITPYVFATHAGKVYLPYLGRYLRTTAGQPGEGLRADIYTKDGQVVFVGYGTDADNGNEALTTGQTGSAYQVGDVLDLAGDIYNFQIPSATPVKHNSYTNNGQSFVFLYHTNDNNHIFRGTGAPSSSGTLVGTPNCGFTSASHLTDSGGIDMGTVPGGSGFTYTIGAVGTLTGAYNTHGNVADTAGNPDTGLIASNPGTYPHPNRSVASYYNEVILNNGLNTGAGSSTLDDYCDALLTQSRQSWEPLLMAESFNDYIRQGFGQEMVGSAYSDLVAPVANQGGITVQSGTF